MVTLSCCLGEKEMGLCATFCAPEVKYRTSIAAQSRQILSYLIGTIMEHVHNGYLCLNAKNPLLKQIDEASNVMYSMSERSS